ncbi:MAG: hypothetical protein AABW61_03130, partial [Candidatus Aenigmatarchaeota archaeon]
FLYVHIPDITYLYRTHNKSGAGNNFSRKYRRQQTKLLFSKHFSESDSAKLKRELYWRRLTINLPWSLTTHLPGRVKYHLRTVRDYIKENGPKRDITQEELESLESVLAILDKR